MFLSISILYTKRLTVFSSLFFIIIFMYVFYAHSMDYNSINSSRKEFQIMEISENRKWASYISMDSEIQGRTETVWHLFNLKKLNRADDVLKNSAPGFNLGQAFYFVKNAQFADKGIVSELEDAHKNSYSDKTFIEYEDSKGKMRVVELKYP